MSPSRADRSPGSVRIVAANRATEIFLIDSTFARRGRALGRLEGTFPAGVYKVRYQLGSEISDEHFVLAPGGREHRTGPRVVARSPAPLPSTGTERNRGGVLELDAAVRRRWWMAARAEVPGPGEGVLQLVLRAGRPHSSAEVLVRRLEPAGTSRAISARWDKGLAPHVYRLRAGTHVLSVRDGGGWLCRAVPVLPGHQTVVSLQAPRRRAGLAGALADSSLLLLRHPVDGDDGELLLQEFAQQALRRSREYLEPGALSSGASPWLRLLGAHGVIEAARATARRPYDPVQLPEAAVEALGAAYRSLQRSALAEIPDVGALGLFARRSSGPVDLDVPPLLATTWRTLVAESLDRPRSVRGGDRALHMARHLRTGSLWFLWWEPEPGGAEPEGLKVSAETLLAPQLRSGASRAPAGAEQKTRLADLADANKDMLARRLQLPIPLVLSLGQQMDADRLRLARERTERRAAALRAGAPVALVALPDGTRVDPDHGQPLDFEAVLHALEEALEAAGVVAVRTPPVVPDSGEMREALACADLLVADSTYGDPAVLAVAKAWLEGAGDTDPRSRLFALRAEDRRATPIPGGAREVSYRASYGTAVSFADPAQPSTALRAALAGRRRTTRSPEREAWAAQVIRVERRRLELRELRAKLGRDPAPLSQLLSGESFRAGLSAEPAWVQRDIFFLLRAYEDWDGMVRAERAMAPDLRRTVLVREQLAFALNRRNREGDSEAAAAALRPVIDEIGDNGETCGLLGRVFKDRWKNLGGGRAGQAGAALDGAIDWYLRGVKASPRDPYPGVNALTLLAVRGTAADLRRHRHLLPHVEAAAGARLELRPNYWELASMLEVAANKRSQAECIFHLRLLLAAPHEPWQLKTTANNLLLLRDAPSAGFRRARRWLEPLADALAHGRYEPAAHTP